MKDFSQGAKYLNLIRRQVPRVLRQEKTELEIRGNSRTEPDIKVPPLHSATKSHHFGPRGTLCGFIAQAGRNLVHISVEECLRFDGCNANHLVSDGSGHALHFLECRAGVHKELMAHELDPFGVSMQYLERRHRPNNMIERCRFLVNQGVGGGDVHDQYGNEVFSNGSDLHAIGRCGMRGVKNILPLKGG